MKTDMEYYVYQLIDPRDGAVFYGGKGTGDRMYRHTPTNSTEELGTWIQEIEDAGLEVIREKIFENLSEQEAWDREIKMIAEIGLDNLCNIMPGGEGVVFTDEVLRKMAEARKGRVPWNKGGTGVYSDEARRKMSDAAKKRPSNRKGHKVSMETRRKISEAKKGRVPLNMPLILEMNKKRGALQ